MSQVDLVGYIPLLLWFIILFTVFYFNIVSYIFARVYFVLSLRNRIYRYYLNLIYILLYFRIIFCKLFSKVSVLSINKKKKHSKLKFALKKKNKEEKYKL